MDHYEPFVACLRLFIAYNEPCRLNQAVLFNPIRTLLCNYKLAPFTTYDARFDFQVHQCFATLTITNKTHSFYTAQQVYIYEFQLFNYCSIVMQCSRNVCLDCGDTRIRTRTCVYS